MLEVVGDASRGGEWVGVRLTVDGDRIVRAEADGLSRSLVGLTLLEAAAVPGEPLATDALANAIGPIFRAPFDSERTAVAMSGGVDSAVALLRAGPAAIGVTLRLWIDPRAPDAERACCSPGAVIAARETCHRLGLPHVTLDAREEFRRAIVEPFVEGYARGETPNPCTRCNGSFRFAQLLALARLDPRKLEAIWFPLGAQTKDETRAEAERAGLSVARRPESQEACFLGGGDYRDFLERHGLEAEEGSLVGEDGRVLGTHRGFWRYTPGQRKGLSVAEGQRAYALRTDVETNTVVVGPREALARRSVTASGRLFASVTRGDAKLRYRSPAVPAAVEETGDGFRLRLDEPAYGIATGQTAVLYEDDVVV